MTLPRFALAMLRARGDLRRRQRRPLARGTGTRPPGDDLPRVLTERAHRRLPCAAGRHGYFQLADVWYSSQDIPPTARPRAQCGMPPTTSAMCCTSSPAAARGFGPGGGGMEDCGSSSNYLERG
ncbi:MAG: hypothetical protein IPH03_03705 [Tetrasphaera sp.]|nr:hypothetical protein [Tetrasphaera sp.]